MTENTTTQNIPKDLFVRQQTVTGLRQLADFLEANPAVPVDEYAGAYTIYLGPQNSEEEGRTRVDRIAALLEVTSEDETDIGGLYTTTKTFGRMSYRVVHIPGRTREEYNARSSYEANIQLNDQGDEQSTGRAAR